MAATPSLPRRYSAAGQASCTSPSPLFNADGGYIVIYTPGYMGYYPYPSASTSANVSGGFWAIGLGDQDVTGPLGGHDNGTYEAAVAYTTGSYYYGWVRFTTLWHGYTISSGSWGHGRVDGCINPNAAQCMAMLLSDEAADDVGYFALLTSDPDHIGNYTGFPSSVTLGAVPAPRITGSTRLGAPSVSLNIAAVTFTELMMGGSVHLNSSCDGTNGANVFEGYRIFARNVASHDVMPPAGRDLSLWSDLSGGTSVALGTPTTVTATCSGETSIFLVTVLDFDSNFENFHVSRA